MTNVALEQALQIAFAQQQAGQLAAAAATFRQILTLHPQYAEAWYRLGVIGIATGRYLEALELIQKAIALSPQQAIYHSDLGAVYRLLGRMEEAIACFQRAVALQADLSDAHLNLGETLSRLGRFAEAIPSCRRGLELRPDYAVAHNNLGNALAQTDQHDEAIACYERALALDPNYAEACCNLGNLFIKLCRWREARPWFERAIALQEDYAEAHGYLGDVLSNLDQPGQAIACYERAIALKPDYAVAHCGIGRALLDLDRVDEAIASCQRALALKSDLAEAHGNLGAAYSCKGQFEQSVLCYRQAIACAPEFAGVHWNLSLTLLLLGQYEEGWREHEWRARLPVPFTPLRNFSAPRWSGASASGKTILLHAEQGFGDTLHFIRYLPLVRARVGRVIVECQPELARLVAGSVSGEAEIVAWKSWDGAALPPFDQHLPMLSLPLALERFAPLPMTEPYLHADPELRAAWRGRLGQASIFRVGLAWAGNPAHKNDRHRSLPFEKLQPLLRVPGVSFYSLQLGTRTEAGVIDLTEHLSDFAETAAFMAELDLIISVDTAAAHLAGALGRPVWTLLPFVPDWRWSVEREDTPWYPTMRLFRQRAAGGWADVLQRVAAELVRACSE